MPAERLGLNAALKRASLKKTESVLHPTPGVFAGCLFLLFRAEATRYGRPGRASRAAGRHDGRIPGLKTDPLLALAGPGMADLPPK